MAVVTFTDHALTDLDQIAEYIAKDAPGYASAIVEAVFKKVEVLQKHPNIGRVVPEFEKKNIRELLYGRYRIVYNVVDSQSIHILAVHHGAQLLSEDSLFE